MTPWKAVPWLVALVAVLVAGWALRARALAEREAVIALENERASRQEVRRLTLEVEHGQTSVATVSALLQRERVELHGALAKLARAEHLTARLRADLAVATRGVDTVMVGNAPPALDSAGRLVDSVVVTGPPITGSVVADMAPTRPTRWGLRLQPDPIPLTVVVGCRVRGKPPELVVTAPDWVTIQPSLGTLDARVCHPTPQKKRWPWLVAGMGLGILTWETLR